jgi:hypothetical protein
MRKEEHAFLIVGTSLTPPTLLGYIGKVSTFFCAVTIMDVLAAYLFCG